MKTSLNICKEFLTGTPVKEVTSNLVEEIRYKALQAQGAKKQLGVMCMDCSDIDTLAGRKLHQEVLKNIDVTNPRSFFWEPIFSKELYEKYGPYYFREINIDRESYGEYISDISITITNEIIKKHIEQSQHLYYDDNDALYHRAETYMKLGYISKNFFARLSEDLGKVFIA